MTQAQLVEAVKSADVLVPTVTDKIDAAVLSQASDRLRLIASFGTGVDHIDLASARQRGITVTNTPGVLTEDTADMTMALILAVARRVSEGERLIRSGKWQGWSPMGMLGHRIHGKRLGIVGMGRIGSAVARRARGFGLSVHYHNRRRANPQLEQQLEATYWESLDQMLARMDIISINCPHTPATYHLLSARRLKLLQPKAYIVNTARGEVIDENALMRMLQSKEIAGAGLDVFEHEPAINPKLLRLDNVVLLPHMGSATHRRPRRHGREGHHQHQDLRRRPQAARPRDRIRCCKKQRPAVERRAVLRFDPGPPGTEQLPPTTLVTSLELCPRDRTSPQDDRAGSQWHDAVTNRQLSPHVIPGKRGDDPVDRDHGDAQSLRAWASDWHMRTSSA